MEKDNFFIITYRILKYLSECMKLGEKPIKLKYENYDINEKYFNEILLILYNKGFITGIKNITDMSDEFSKILIISPKITYEGLEFLENNSTLEKAKNALKTIKNIVPFI